MFYSLTGNVIMVDANYVAVECSGIGFKCNSSLNTLRKVGEVGSKVTLYTYLAVREDAMELYGFSDSKELDCFKLLISVSGVGPKAALAVLSEMTPEKLAFYIANGDSKSITKAQGVGPKIAQRIVLELKGKMSADIADNDSDNSIQISETTSSNIGEAISALQFLGYSQYEASKAVKSLDPSMSVEDMIKQALVLLSKNI